MVGISKKVPYTNFICGGDSFATPVEFTVTGTGTGNYIVKSVVDTLDVGIMKTGCFLAWNWVSAIMKAAAEQRAYLMYAIRDKTKKPNPPAPGDLVSLVWGIWMVVLTTYPNTDFVNNTYSVFYVGDTDDFANTFDEGDEVVIDILFVQRDMYAGTNAITLYCYQHEIPYCIR